MKKLIQHVALYQDHGVLEGQNIAIDGSRITGFPEAPKASDYDEVIDGKGMLPCRVSSIPITMQP